MSTEQNHAYFQQALSGHLGAIGDPHTRNGVVDLLALTKEEEDKKKELAEAKKAKQIPKPAGDVLASLVSIIDLTNIEQTAGVVARQLVESLIEYTATLIANNAAENS